MQGNRQKRSYSYLDELQHIRKTGQRRTGKLNWKDYVMPQLAAQNRGFDYVRAASQYGKFEKDYSADASQNTNTTTSDKERIAILTHQNKNLKEELNYLRETLFKVLQSKKAE